MTGYYDYVLGLIPVSLLGITAILSVIGLPLTAAVPVGAAVAILIIGHAVFVNVPVATDSPEPLSNRPHVDQQATQTRQVNAD
ncbi:MAG: hypothetical protein ACQETB_12775 [Halobacteriota archaeon]